MLLILRKHAQFWFEGSLLLKSQIQLVVTIMSSKQSKTNDLYRPVFCFINISIRHCAYLQTYSLNVKRVERVEIYSKRSEGS